jgi:hypothetical protein
MRSALPNHYPFDLRATNAARFAGSLVNVEMVLEVPTTVDPVNTGAVAADAFFEHPPDGAQ